MADIGVAVDAILHAAGGGVGQQRMDKVLVARNASALRYPSIPRLDLDRVLEVAGCERQRMEESVVGLGDPFANEIVWQVAVVANGDVVMAALLPRIHMILHHMTVDAGLWIVAHVAGTLAISEREHTDPRKHAQANCE